MGGRRKRERDLERLGRLDDGKTARTYHRWMYGYRAACVLGPCAAAWLVAHELAGQDTNVSIALGISLSANVAVPPAFFRLWQNRKEKQRLRQRAQELENELETAEAKAKERDEAATHVEEKLGESERTVRELKVRLDESRKQIGP